MQLTGQTAAHGGSVQCIQAMETDRSPGLPSLMVTTRRRLMPQGTSFSFLPAVTQALQRNFIRAMMSPSRDADLAEGSLGLLHARRRVEAIGCQRVDALAQNDRV